MQTTYLFEASRAAKVYGDCSPVLRQILVVGAETKAVAKEQALKCAAGMRIVNAGSRYKDQDAAMARVAADKKLTESLIAKGHAQFGPVAECVIVNLNKQRSIARLLGM